MPELMRECERTQRAHGVDEQRMRAVERLDEAEAASELGPAPRLHGARAFECELDIFHLPRIARDAALKHETTQIAVSRDLVKAVVVHAEMGDMGRHFGASAFDRQVKEALVAGRIELQHGAAELEPLRPVCPAARLVSGLARVPRRRLCAGPGW